MKKWLWVIVVSLPIISALWTVDTLRSVDFGYRVAAPRYAEANESALAQLDNKSLAKLSASLLNDHKKMGEWWRGARGAYDVLIYGLLIVVFLMAAILGAILWRMPSNPALNTDAGRAQRAG